VKSAIEDMVVDLVVSDGFLSRPEELVASLRSPSGRAPSEVSRRTAEAMSKLNDEEALRIVRSVLDAGVFSVFSLFDSDFKNSGLHAEFSCGDQMVDTRTGNQDFWDAYRSRVEPGGMLAALPH